VLIGCIGSLWGMFMIIVLCLPQEYPCTATNFNYSPLMLGSTLIYALLSWFYSARKWFKGAIINEQLMDLFVRGTIDKPSVDERVTDVESSEDMVVVSLMVHLAHNPLPTNDNDDLVSY